MIVLYVIILITGLVGSYLTYRVLKEYKKHRSLLSVHSRIDSHIKELHSNFDTLSDEEKQFEIDCIEYDLKYLTKLEEKS